MMKTFTTIVFALWIITIGVFGYFFVAGSTEKSTDNRTAVLLSPIESDLILGEMRTMLAAVSGVLNGLGEGDMKKASAAARSAGMAMAVDTTPVLMAKLPLEFKNLGMSVHGDFDLLASDIDTGLTQQQVVQRLGATTTKCVACHAAYRLRPEAAPGQ
jgi:cytochrome c556